MAPAKPKANRRIQVAVENLQKKIPLNLPRIAALTKAILRYEGIRQAALSIVFVSSPKIRSLNRRYLRRDHVTDVLAFDLRDDPDPKEVSGDIAICVDVALRNAGKYRTSLDRELVLYVAHGILHLLGFDDHRPRDVRAMRGKEQEILNYLGKRALRVVSCEFAD